MAKAKLYNQKGEIIKDITLDKNIFDMPINMDLITRMYNLQLSNARINCAHTQTRAEVSASGSKLFRQKGTGRARPGSNRSPLRKGGGITFGPRNERNFTKSMPKKMARKALFSALSLAVKDKKIIIVDEFKNKEIKTKDFFTFLNNLKLDKKTLIVVPEKDEIIQKSSNNINFVKTILYNFLNVKDVMDYKNILIFEKSLNNMTTLFLKDNK